MVISEEDPDGDGGMTGFVLTELITSGVEGVEEQRGGLCSNTR